MWDTAQIIATHMEADIWHAVALESISHVYIGEQKKKKVACIIE